MDFCTPGCDYFGTVNMWRLLYVVLWFASISWRCYSYHCLLFYASLPCSHVSTGQIRTGINAPISTNWPPLTQWIPCMKRSALAAVCPWRMVITRPPYPSPVCWQWTARITTLPLTDWLMTWLGPRIAPLCLHHTHPIITTWQITLMPPCDA